MKSRHFPKSPDSQAALNLLHEIAQSPATGLPRKVDKNLALYGAGALGRLAMDYFRLLGIDVAFVVDTDAHLRRTESYWKGVRILHGSEVSEADRQSVLLAVCVAKFPFTEVATPLMAGGWQDVVPFYTISAAYAECHPLGNGWFTGTLGTADIAGMEWVLPRYHDDISRAHHIQFLAWHCLHEEWFFEDAPVTTENRYFIPELQQLLTDAEVFIDLGAHHGHTTETFIGMVKQKFDSLLAIEPDRDNYREYQNALLSYPAEVMSRIATRHCAIGSANQTQRFYTGLDFASKLCLFGNTDVETQTIDSMAIHPTFIKAHLEGSEMDALTGAKGTIRIAKPLVAATVYHNNLGLWAIQKYAMEEFAGLDYRFIFRLHSWHGTGAVLYLLNR